MPTVRIPNTAQIASSGYAMMMTSNRVPPIERVPKARNAYRPRCACLRRIRARVTTIACLLLLCANLLTACASSDHRSECACGDPRPQTVGSTQCPNAAWGGGPNFAVTENAVLVASSSNVFAFDFAGRPIWRRKLKEVTPPGDWSDDTGTLAYYNHFFGLWAGTLYAATSSTLHWLDPQTGELEGWIQRCHRCDSPLSKAAHSGTARFVPDFEVRKDRVEAWRRPGTTSYRASDAGVVVRANGTKRLIEGAELVECTDGSLFVLSGNSYRRTDDGLSEKEIPLDVKSSERLYYDAASQRLEKVTYEDGKLEIPGACWQTRSEPQRVAVTRAGIITMEEEDTIRALTGKAMQFYEF